MPVDDAPVEKVGPYRLMATLGEGGMGVVHRAVDDAGREVALKVVRAEFAEDATFRRRCLRCEGARPSPFRNHRTAARVEPGAPVRRGNVALPSRPPAAGTPATF